MGAAPGVGKWPPAPCTGPALLWGQSQGKWDLQTAEPCQHMGDDGDLHGGGGAGGSRCCSGPEASAEPRAIPRPLSRRRRAPSSAAAAVPSGARGAGRAVGIAAGMQHAAEPAFPTSHPGPLFLLGQWGWG